MKKIHDIMLAGTGSDVGKSVIATALCRIFLQDGFHPAPFKAQNMALNSYVTSDGLEIGRAQAVQAEACGIPCRSEMNPLLLKPTSEHTSQVIMLGKPIGNRNACEYFTSNGREALRKKVCDSFDTLAKEYNPVVLEGAGSISELNLADSDLVNMPMARHADADVILVVDIDRGGVFASAYGSIKLQSPEDQKRIKGIIVNKFRGDLTLFENGKKILEEICDVPVLGVIPYYDHITIEEEDSVSLDSKRTNADNQKINDDQKNNDNQKIKGDQKINIAVIRLPHISNFTDFDCLERDERVCLYYTVNPKEIAKADIIILPGTKSTIADLIEIKNNGAAEAIIKAHRNGKTVWGICGGYQMMGNSISDPDKVEGNLSLTSGLGLLPTETVLNNNKLTRQIKAVFMPTSQEIEGYEIHNGITKIMNHGNPVIQHEAGIDGVILNNKCLGTYLHGILDNNCVIEYLLSSTDKNISREKDKISAKDYKEKQYDLLADHVRKHLNMELLYKIIGND